MTSCYHKMPDGYRESIQKGMDAVRRFGRRMSSGTGSEEERIRLLREKIREADAVVIGGGSGLSTSAGLTYSGQRFRRYFFDFAERFGIRDIYSGGFYPFPDEETRWAWWARHIYYNRCIDAPLPVYSDLLRLVKEKDYFVITTNVDNQFQRAGFDEKRLFCAQGDYGLFQSEDPADQNTYDNSDWVEKAMADQGFVKDENGVFQVPETGKPAMRISAELIPTCPGGAPAVMNLRCDDTFVEDEKWHLASAAYADFLQSCETRSVLFLELGVGGNTPVIIKFPFWLYTAENPKAFYACVNRGEACCPEEIAARSVCIDGDIGSVLSSL